MGSLLLEAHDRHERLDSATRADGVTDQRLGGIDQHVTAEYAPDYITLNFIIGLRAGAVGIYVLYIGV